MRSLSRPDLIRFTSSCLLALVSASLQLAPGVTSYSNVEDVVSKKVLRKVVRDAGSRRSRTRLEAWRRLAQMGPELTPWRVELEENAHLAAQNAFAAILDGDLMDELAALARRRADLDRSRAFALELIRDAERYFYPSTTPDVTVERARQFPEVRREVEGRVEAVRALWENDRGVDTPEKVRTAISEVMSIERVAETIGFEVTWPSELPRWILGVVQVPGRIDLRNFAWTDEQEQQLRYDRAVDTYNESRWMAEASRQTADADGSAGAPARIECEQVRVTNAYRRLFGERALVWSEALQRAAHGHSLHMARTVVMTHSQSLLGYETPVARMRSEGYSFGLFENIYFGPGGALAAHVRWVGSSAHHRALLDPRLRGMASAEKNGYWTQNLGSNTSFTGTPEFKKALWHD
ncbi:MAG: hypothetical protein ACI8QZ_002513 [Chlamydiales bacterium]|jgi:uncharacterized protein YkwD